MMFDFVMLVGYSECAVCIHGGIIEPARPRSRIDDRGSFESHRAWSSGKLFNTTNIISVSFKILETKLLGSVV